ncbi:hypothetical protein N7535_008597 [Penicillium sp. DV-2018c]|nr:hypothetical protein N7535_008597 [Penicillium sp. DV-2018c]
MKETLDPKTKTVDNLAVKPHRPETRLFADDLREYDGHEDPSFADIPEAATSTRGISVLTPFRKH